MQRATRFIQRTGPNLRRFATQVAVEAKPTASSSEKSDKYRRWAKTAAFYGLGIVVALDLNTVFSDDKKGYPVWNEKNHSMLRKYLTPEVYEKLKDRRPNTVLPYNK